MTMRICMFVYNNCAHDPRVLKEARSLTAAGHSVQIVAVLDKTTVSEEERDGFTIVRIDRNPPHYRILRFSRRVRRWLRLTRARTRRWFRRHGGPWFALWHAVVRATSPVGRALSAAATQISTAAAGVPQKRAARAKARRLTRIETKERRAERLTLAAEAARVAADEPTPDQPLGPGDPRRIYRGLRWRVLRRSVVARNLYYGRRTRRKGKSIRKARHAAAEAAALREALTPQAVAATVTRPADVRDGEPTAIDTPTNGSAAQPSPAPVERGPVAVLGHRVERAMSHAAYRTVMLTHRPMMHLDYYMRAYKLVRPQDFDAYHAHDLNTLPVAAALARKNGKRLVYDAHELYTEISTLSRSEKRVWRTVEPRLIRRAASVITVCESIAGELQQRYGVAKPEILLNCSPVSGRPDVLDRGALRDLLGMQDDPRAIVLYQGGLAPNRGLEELVLAGRYLAGGRIVLMGNGRIREQLAELIRKNRLEDVVVLTPAVPPSQVIPYAAGADVGVIPYKGVGLNNYYTTPNKLFDYMAARLPIAGSRFPEIVRFVEGLGLGVTFDPESPRDIAFSINYLLDDPSLLGEMREAAAAAAPRYTWERQEPKLLALYGTEARVREPALAL